MAAEPIAGVPDDPLPDLPAGQSVLPSGTPEIKALLWLAVAAMVIATLLVAQDVLIPIILAVMLSFVLTPMVSALERLGLRRAPSVMATVLVACGVLALAGMLVAGQASSLGRDAPRYARTIQEKVQGLQLLATTRLTILRRQVETPPAPAPVAGPRGTAPAGGLLGRNSTPGTPGAPQPVLVEMAREEPSPLVVARTILAPVLGPLETTLIVLVIAIFILMEREDLRDRFIRLAGSSDLHRTTAAMDDAATRLSRYFISQLGVNATFGAVIGVGLWLIGIPSAGLWAVLAGLLRFVPYVGPVLAAVAPIALGAAIDPGWWTAVKVLMLFAVIEPFTGYVVEPLLYGHSTGLSPISVIVAAVFWTWVWGPIGLILSTPLTLCLVVLGRHVKSLEFFDVLLGDRAPLAPGETLYQRILADNPDEALDKAEELLGNRPLLEYYDGVVLEALRLAAQDEARGAIAHERAARMTRSMLQVIDDLEEHVDVHAASEAALARSAPAAAAGVVVCVSGHGVFDDAVSGMLAQLLVRRGTAAKRVPHAAITRDRIAALDLRGVRVVALSYLDTAGSLTRLRYTVRRIRQHSSEVTIVVGLWPAGDDAGRAPSRDSVGADRYVASLREALDACS